MNQSLRFGCKRLADYKSERLKMSKKILKPLAALSPVLVLAMGLFLGPHVERSRAQAPAAAKGNARNSAIIETTAAVLKETSDLRKLSILRNVKSGAQSRSDIEKMILKNLDEETTPAEMHATEVLLRVFGLAPAEFQYRPSLVKLLTEQVAGYYDPKAQQFYLADWIELDGQKPVMAHELTHALQDQHFNLRRFEKWPKGDSDAELAAHALIEGDATLAMMLYMAKNPMIALAFVRSLGGQSNSSEQFKQTPRAIRESLLFPYEQGSLWATQVYRRGGWEMVSEAFKKLPQSSEQILHPEKYFSNEAPVQVSLPDLNRLLGSGWTRVDDDVNGEWGFYLIIDQFLNDTAHSKAAAAGWSGDRFALYEEPKSGALFVAQMSVWDTADDAKEFYDAYAKRTLRRYPNAKAVDASNTHAEGQSAEWQTSEGDVVMQLRGSRVLIIEGLPSTANKKGILTSLWQ
jgi:hypothetical protein